MLARNRRVQGLKLLANATLVELLFGHFFAFAVNQFAALGALIVQLVVLGVLRFGISSETHSKPDGTPGLPAAEIIALEDSRSGSTAS